MIWIPNETYWINDDGSVSYECAFCNNCYTEKEGFSLKTNQCKGCDDYDREEPARKKERDRLTKWQKEYGHIPYSPGDSTY